jgi:hypothetical protein
MGQLGPAGFRVPKGYSYALSGNAAPSPCPAEWGAT